MGGSSNDGFNLVSNPYPGTIDWQSGSWTKQNVSATYYTWNSCTNSYASYASGVGVNGGTRLHSIYARLLGEGIQQQPEFKNSEQRHGGNSQAMLKQSTQDDSVNFVLRMTLENDEVAIRLDAASTSSLDNETDSPKFFTPDSKICTTTSLSGIDYAINSVKSGDQVVPVRTKGGGTLSFRGITSFFDKYSIYLKDLVNKNYLPITEGMEYDFTDTSVVSFSSRFEIVFKEKKY